jgi:phage tail sheath gpL-like
MIRTDLKAVQRMLGPAKSVDDARTYADLFDEDLGEVADRLDTAIKSAADALRTAKVSYRTVCTLTCRNLVELRGFEPLTYSMRTSRATNCAIAPDR